MKGQVEKSKYKKLELIRKGTLIPPNRSYWRFSTLFLKKPMYNKHIILFLRALLFASHWINWGYIYINHQLIPWYANKMALRSKIICLLYIKNIICIIHKTEHIEYIYINSLHKWRNITTWWWKLKAWVLFPPGLVRKELSLHLLQVQPLEPKE